METNEDQKVARQDATPPSGATNGGSDGDSPAADGEGDPGPDEITLKVANPLLRHEDVAAPLTPTPCPLDSPSAAKLKEASQLWDELNSMPATPPPQRLGQVNPSDHAGPSLPSKRRYALLFALVTAAVGAGAGAGFFALRATREAASTPAHESPRPATPVKPSDIVETRSAREVAMPTSPTRREKRHIRITVQPAQASLVLDGTVAKNNVIALEREPDQALHVVEATAPGYLPFKQSFTLDGDVHLDINLQRPEPQVAKPRRPESHVARLKRPEPPAASALRPERLPDPPAETAQPAESVTKVKPVEAPVEEFGMDLQRSAPRRQTKKIDDKDPYAP